MKWVFTALVTVLFASLQAVRADGVDYEDPKEADPARRGPFHIEEHPACTLAVVGKLKKIKRADSGESRFYFRVPLKITNAGANPVSVSGYGDWDLLSYFQRRDAGEKKWPALKVTGVCGTGLRSFTLAPGESHEFEASMETEVAGTEFRFCVAVTDPSLKPPDRIVMTATQVFPKD